MADKTAFKFLEANRVKVGSFTRDATLASGNQVVSGIGFKPKVVIFFEAVDNVVGQVSWGIDDGAYTNCIWDRHAAVANTWGIGAIRSIFAYQAGGPSYSGKITSLDTDGFTIAWTRTGAASGTLNVMYIAYA